jgi:hypothetical protein
MGGMGLCGLHHLRPRHDRHANANPNYPGTRRVKTLAVVHAVADRRMENE